MRRRILAERTTLAAAVIILTAASGCSKDSSSGATDAAAAQTSSGAAPKADQGGAGGPGGATRSQSITLAPNDVLTLRPQPMEEATPITGSLLPMETVDVRARVDGILTGVYAREGTPVRTGQVLARFEASQQQSDVQSAEADRSSAQTDVAAAQWNFDQSKDLFKAGAIAERDLKVAEQAVQSAKARLAASDAKLRAVNLAERDTRVLATTNGVVEKRMVETGEAVARNTVLMTVVNSNVLELAAQLPERKSNGIHAGQTVHFTANGKQLEGKIARVSPTVDAVTRSITVYAQLPNSSNAIRGGTFATGRIVGRTVNGAIVIPISALHQTADSGRPYVYRIDGKAIGIAQVALGIVDEQRGMAQVTDGLKSGDRIIVGNVGAIGRGMQVDIQGETQGGGRRGAGNASGPPSNSK
ncbi:MAG: efflux RND transporter periplasmic adaptor subunit [Gemmatimonadota bacterium]|nr:efflux RND transporter periplasmic adaptor subunit [Gemmatimonadota bacterium]